MFLDDIDYLVVVVPCFIYPGSSLLERKYALTSLKAYHDHLAFTCILLHLEHPAPPLICVYASYRLAGEQGRARGAGGDPVQGLQEGHESKEEL
jgi:hypothetical protein